MEIQLGQIGIIVGITSTVFGLINFIFLSVIKNKFAEFKDDLWTKIENKFEDKSGSSLRISPINDKILGINGAIMELREYTHERAHEFVQKMQEHRISLELTRQDVKGLQEKIRQIERIVGQRKFFHKDDTDS